jgi:hypothetical protein
MRCIALLLLSMVCVLAFPPSRAPLMVRAAAAGGGGGCAASTNNPTADTEVGTWSKEPAGAATHFGIIDEGRGNVTPPGDEYIYKFDDGATDTDTLRFEGPDGSCDVTAVSITAMVQSNAGTPGWACRVSPDNSTWTAWITNAMTTSVTEQSATWSVSWTTPNDVYVQLKTTTGDFSVARIFSMQALVNIAP